MHALTVLPISIGDSLSPARHGRLPERLPYVVDPLDPGFGVLLRGLARLSAKSMLMSKY